MTITSRSRKSRFLFQYEAADGLDSSGNLIIRSGQTPTYARGGTANSASATDAAGRIFFPGYKSPRFTHRYNSTTGLWDFAGLRLEPSRTNRCLYSEDCGNAAWVKTSTTATAAVGTYAGLSFSRLSSLSAGSDINQQLTFVGDGTKGIQFCVKTDGNAGSFRVLLYDFTASAPRLQITVTVAASGVVSAAALAGTLLLTEAMGDGVYRFLCSAPSVVAANTNKIYWLQAGVTTLTSVLVSGMDCEDGPPTAYKRTTSAAVTRSADAFSLNVGFLPQILTVYAKYVNLAGSSSGSARSVWSLGSPGSNDSLELSEASATTFNTAHWGPGGVASANGGTVGAYGAVTEVRSAISTATQVLTGVSINSAAETVVTDIGSATIGPSFSPQVLTIGVRPDGSFPNAIGLISLRIAAALKTLAQVQAA